MRPEQRIMEKVMGETKKKHGIAKEEEEEETLWHTRD